MTTLAVSNIAWTPFSEERVLSLLRERSVACIEVAPTVIWPEWRGATPEAAAAHRRRLAEHGFTVAAFQSLFYATPEVKIFRSEEDRRRAIEHLRLVGELALAMGANRLVFGAPRTRNREGLNQRDAWNVAKTFFREAGDVCAAFDVLLCIEPNPEQYHCDFLTRSCEAQRFVRAVAHPHVRLQLDTACVHLAGDSMNDAISECMDILAHFHVSEPFLSDFSAPAVDHAAVGKQLAAAGYDDIVSIEMRRTNTPEQAIAHAVERVLEWYILPK